MYRSRIIFREKGLWLLSLKQPEFIFSRTSTAIADWEIAMTYKGILYHMQTSLAWVSSHWTWPYIIQSAKGPLAGGFDLISNWQQDWFLTPGDSISFFNGFNFYTTEEHYILCGVRTLTSLPSNPRRLSYQVKMYEFTVISRTNHNTQDRKWVTLPSYAGQIIILKNERVYRHTRDKLSRSLKT